MHICYHVTYDPKVRVISRMPLACSSYGFEFDLFEGNVDSMHSTAHGCVSGLDVPGSNVKSGFAPGAGVGSSGWYGRIDRSSYPDPNVRLMHNQICDADGVGVGISGTGVQPLGNRSYGWGDAFTINTQHPFDVAIRFDDESESREAAPGSSAGSWSYTTTLKQGGRSLWRTTRKADAVTEQAIFPRPGPYSVRLVEAQRKQWVVVDDQYLPRVAARADASRTVHRLSFAADGTTVEVLQQLRLGDAIDLGGVLFSNNVTSNSAMRTSRRQLAWDELGVSLRSRGLAMVLAYWAQGRTSSYKELGEWDTFWLNGECERQEAPFPWQEAMGWGCISHIRIERNPGGSNAPANIHGQEPLDGGSSRLSARAEAPPLVAELAVSSLAALVIFFCWRRRDGLLLWMRGFLRRNSRLLLPQQEEPIEPSGSAVDKPSVEAASEDARDT